MSDTTYIYGLIDPRTQELRYIGKTYDLSKRLRYHATQRFGKNHRARWILSLYKIGLCPEIFIIEEISTSLWEDSERFWINYFRSIGADLTNGMSWGIGGISPTQEVRDRMSKSHKGKKFTDEHRRKIGEANKGKRLPDEAQ